jgi:hypothetical protein
MCVVNCDADYAIEDAGTTYLTWENGRYVPAPPLLYVPGLRAIFQKHSERAKWQPASRDLARTCALPDTYYAGHAPGRAQRAIISAERLCSTSQGFSRYKLCYQATPPTVATSAGSISDTGGGGCCRQSQPNGGSEDEGLESSQRSPGSPRNATNTAPPHFPSSQGDSPSHTLHSTVDGAMQSQKTPQKANPASFSARRPLAEASSFDVRNKYRPKTMSLAAIEKQAALGVTISKSVTPPRQSASTSSATSLKSILKSSSSSTSTVSQGRPPRKKDVRFAFDLESSETGVGPMLKAVKWPRRLPSPPPRATRSTSPMPQHPQHLSSSAGKASSQLMEVQARHTKGAKGISRRDGNKQMTQKLQAKAQPQSSHQILTMENLAVLSDQIGVNGVWEDEDDTASNTDFELAVRMKRRWI